MSKSANKPTPAPAARGLQRRSGVPRIAEYIARPDACWLCPGVSHGEAWVRLVQGSQERHGRIWLRFNAFGFGAIPPRLMLRFGGISPWPLVCSEGNWIGLGGPGGGHG